MFTLMAVSDVMLAVAVVRTWGEPGAGRFIPRWFAGTLLAVMAGTAAWVWPHGLSYTNQLWGGVEHGYRHLSDSNYDWGQGLPALKAWNREHNDGQQIGVWYFGTDPAILFPPFKAVYVNGLIAGTLEELRTAAGARYFAVSTSLLYGHESELPGHKAILKWFRETKPVGRTQHFFVYDLDAK
jgi:hypothetical protein